MNSIINNLLCVMCTALLRASMGNVCLLKISTEVRSGYVILSTTSIVSCTRHQTILVPSVQFFKESGRGR